MNKKGKAGPLQAWTGPDGSRKLRFPDFVTTAQDGGKVVSLTHRPPLPPGNTPGTHFSWRLSRPQGHSATGRVMSIKNTIDIGFRAWVSVVTFGCCNFFILHEFKKNSVLILSVRTVHCHHQYGVSKLLRNVTIFVRNYAPSHAGTLCFQYSHPLNMKK